MSNLDFLLNCTDACDTSIKKDGDNQIVRATFCGYEDLSWSEYEYVFDKDGNYISMTLVDSHC